MRLGQGGAGGLGGPMGEVSWHLLFPSGAPDRIGDMFASAVVADAVRRYDADLAQSVETCRDWPRAYRAVFRSMTALAASSPAASVGMATEGLRSARNLFRLVTGPTVAPLHSVELDAVADPAEAGLLPTGRIDGQAKPPARLQVPFRGRMLAEESLRRLLTDWRRRGIVEPGFAAAVERVMDHPEWLALPGFRAVVLGATELGPLRPLLQWGADVVAIDLPGRERWRSLSEFAKAGAGILRHPITTGPGADIATQFPALMRWVRAQVGAADADGSARPVFGVYANRPGAQGVRLAAAADVLARDLLSFRPDAALAMIGSPTDCYAVPESVVAEAHARYRGRGLGQNLVRTLTGSGLFRPNYRTLITDHLDATWSVVDTLIQGPNHALAHRLLRWRAVLAHAAGRTVSYTVAPPVATALPLALAAAFRGAHRFGIEIFEPDTARTLLAAKLVADLFDPPVARADANPEELFALGAAHGGVWHQPFEPRSILPVAMALGLR